MLTNVLLNVARILAMPLMMFLAPLALTIFLPANSSASNSAAVGAAAGTPAAGAASVALTPSAAAGWPSPPAAGAFLPLAGAPSLVCLEPAFAAASGFASVSALASFFGEGFFFSSAIKNRTDGMNGSYVT